MRKTHPDKKHQPPWSKELIIPVMLACGAVLFATNGKIKISVWFMLFTLLLGYLQRQHLSLRTTFEAITYAGGWTLTAALCRFIAPWAGRSGPMEREDSYPTFIFGLVLTLLGFTLRNWISNKNT